MAGRGFSGSYRFGYQGSEKDNEVSGDGNSYTTEFRQLDPRLGRWFSVDPEFFPWQSPYTSMDNNPIRNVDRDGRGIEDAVITATKTWEDGKTTITLTGSATIRIKVINLSAETMDVATFNAKAKTFFEANFSNKLGIIDQYSTNYDFLTGETKNTQENIQIKTNIKYNFIFEEIKDLDHLEKGDMVLAFVDKVNDGDAVGIANGSGASTGGFIALAPAKYTAPAGGKDQSGVAYHEVTHLIGASDNYTAKSNGQGLMGNTGVGTTPTKNTIGEVGLEVYWAMQNAKKNKTTSKQVTGVQSSGAAAKTKATTFIKGKAQQSKLKITAPKKQSKYHLNLKKR